MKKLPSDADDFLPGFFTEEQLDAIAREEMMPLVDKNLSTDYRCPACTFEWSGAPKPEGADLDLDDGSTPTPATSSGAQPVARARSTKPGPVPTQPALVAPSSVATALASLFGTPVPERVAVAATDAVSPTSETPSGTVADVLAGAEQEEPAVSQEPSTVAPETDSGPVELAPEPVERLRDMQAADVLASPAQLDDVSRSMAKRLNVSAGRPLDQGVFDLGLEVEVPNESTENLATFLSSGSSCFVSDAERDYVLDEPPSLDGIDEIVLNFATDGLDWRRGNTPVGVTVASVDGAFWRFLPFRFAGGNLDESVVKEWARRELRGKKILNANTRFDIHMARAWGIDLDEQGCTFSDIMHTAALLDDHRKRFSLDVLVADYLPNEPMVARLDESHHHLYHAAQAKEREIFTALAVAKLRDEMYPQLTAQELETVQGIEDDVIPAVVEMEKNGAPVDVEMLAQFSRECNAEYGRLMMEVSEACGFAFEHTAKGWQRLIESLGLPVPKSFDEETLSEIAHPLIKLGQSASQHASLNSKIFKPYSEAIGADGVLYYDINQLRGDDGGTVSGRFSIGYVQQVPNHDNHAATFGEKWFPRRLFVPRFGKMLEADAAQIEYRILAHLADNPAITKAYRENPKQSWHKMTWEMMKVYKPDLLYSHQKSFNFARQYGAKSIKLAVMMGFITEAEGNEIKAEKRWNDPRLDVIHGIEAAYSKMMPQGDELLARAAHLAKPKCDDKCRPGDRMHKLFPHRGYVKTLSGRRSRFPTAWKTYIGLNRVIQGTGADIMKMKLAELHKARKDTGLVMRLTIHDAVVGDALAPDTQEKVDAILERQSLPLQVPILWESGVGTNWAECKK